MLKRLLPLALFGALALPSHAGLFDDDEARKQIATIRDQHETKLKELAEKLEQLDARNGQKLVELVGQFDTMNQQIANLRGQIEVLNFNLQNLQKRQQDLYVDLDGRLRAIEEGKSAGGQNPMAQAASAEHEAEAATAYEAAYNLYRDNKLKTAIDSFAALVQKYPNSQATPNALFWMGIAQAQIGDGKSAQLAWHKLIDTFPDHAKAPDAMRAIASVQLEKGDKKAALKTLKDLMAAYPNSEAAKDAAKQLKKM
jgi:tol-pal system protein YbgF